MSHAFKKFLERILFFPCLLFLKVTRLLPLPVARGIGMRLADIAFYLVPRIKRVGLANLDIAYGDRKSREEKLALLRDSVRNLGIIAAEFSRMPLLVGPEAEKHAQVRGLEHVNMDAGAILVGAHLGNWEWMMSVAIHSGLRVAVVVREFDDPKMNALIDAMRRESGVKTIPKDAAMGPLLRKLREGWQVGILADQSPRDNGAPVSFFGKETWATVGPVLIAMRAHLPLTPASMTRNPDYSYTLEFYPPLALVRTGDMLADLRTNTQRMQDALEEIIRRHPEQWLWFHRRFKTRTRLEREWAERLERRKVGSGVVGCAGEMQTKAEDAT